MKTKKLLLHLLPILVISSLISTPVFSQHRCATPSREERALLYPDLEFVPADCSATSTNPTTDYDPTSVYQITVVVHILMDDSCSNGVISDQQVASQIEILNEDFQALTGSNGEQGNYSGIQFVLATTDPSGAPTTGITRTCNTTYFNDGGSYYNELAWDPNRYMNVYTNQAGGNLGYVPFLPADGGGANVGQSFDRVVVLWNSFGRNGPIGPPYNQGRTGTHEVGHYLGLEHTFSGGCGTSACYTSGDLICDTNPEASPNFSDCSGTGTSCSGQLRPIHNYMNYSDDLCMWEFTVEQNRRMRCTLESFRTNLYTVVGGCAGSDLAVEAGTDQSICSSQTAQLQGAPSGGAGNYSYSWQPTTGLSDPTIANPVASPAETTTYTLTVTDGDTCTSSDSLTVNVVQQATYPDWRTDNSNLDLDGNGTIDIRDYIGFNNTCID